MQLPDDSYKNDLQVKSIYTNHILCSCWLVVSMDAVMSDAIVMVPMKHEDV